MQGQFITKHKQGESMIIPGNSFLIKEINENLKKFAPYTNAHILITGETGTGKSIIAKAIHELSGLSGPLVTISYLENSFAESVLFGHVKGAYTGAQASRQGAVKNADSGTLFIDEIGDLPLDVQIKLLRFIETGEFQQMGSDKVEKANVRVVSATNSNLTEKIKKKKFREDLYYRINMFHIEVPPLRERKEDLPIWIELFFREYWKAEKNHTYYNRKNSLLKHTKNLSFPGNLRELKNLVLRAIILNGIKNL